MVLTGAGCGCWAPCPGRSGFSAPGPSAPCTASPVAARAWTTPLPATGGGHRRGDHGAEQVRPGAAVHRWRSSGSAGGGDHGDGMRLDAEPRPRLIRPIVRTSGRWYSSAESLRSIGSFWSLTGCAEHVLVRWGDGFTVFCHLSHHTPLACADASGTGSVWCCCPPDAGVRCPRRPVCGGRSPLYLAGRRAWGRHAHAVYLACTSCGLRGYPAPGPRAAGGVSRGGRVLCLMCWKDLPHQARSLTCECSLRVAPARSAGT